MWEDPIVAEVRRVREELAGRFNFDIHAIFADIRSRERQLGNRLVRAPADVNAPVETDAERRGDRG